MKAGDIIEWRGVNKVLRGVITESENGRFHVKMDNGHTFPLNDLCHSMSAKLIESCTTSE